MNEYLAWGKILESGGPTLVVLAICSIISLVVIIERWLYFRPRQVDLDSLFANLNRASDQAGSSVLLSENTPVHYVLRELLSVNNLELFEEIKSRAIAEKIPEMEKYLNIEATLGTVSPFIGLLGTVLGIIRAFQSLGESSGNLSGLNQGIAEALIATAAGLFVAIPATIAFNYFRKKVDTMVLRMEIAASRFKERLFQPG